jgi:hypothetical protein
MNFRNVFRTLFAVIMLLCLHASAYAQGVTTGSMTGLATDNDGVELIGATVIAIHQPSGTRYGTTTNVDGRYNIPAMRVGGPYVVSVSYVGYEDNVQSNIYVSLGSATNVNFRMLETAVELEGIEVIALRGDAFSSERTGAATNISSQAINSFPTLTRNIQDFTRLTPQANGSSFAGQDNRLNNITVDGSLFNNSFGLAGAPGQRTGTAPISLDAIEEIQVNIAPYDVRQAGFIGAGINAVTRSGTNDFSGSIFYNIQNQKLVGTNARDNTVTTADFDNTQYGFRLGGPIVRNKLFFFVNGELERRSNPLQLRPNAGGEPVGGAVTRVLRSDLDAVSSFLSSNFGYDTGPYEGYNLETKGDKFLAKLDYNISDKHKASLRYTMLDSQRDVLASNSSSLGFGNRNTINSLNFRNTNYIQLEKLQSVIGEVNSMFGGRVSNNLILGFTYQNEDRGSRGDFFPLVEIQQGGINYISTGFEPFTPNNQLSYRTYQFQNNTSFYLKKHTITAGLNFERLSFRNVFFPGSQGVFVFNSLDDFYADLSDAVDQPNRTVSPVTLRRFQYRYSALPGGAEPVQPTRVNYGGLYLQDAWQATRNFNLLLGVRIDVPFFEDTGFENPTVAQQTYRIDGQPLRVSTSKLPEPKLLFSPRLGFNWDVKDDRTLQVRGGTGLFTGRPVFVWISNQIGNNGVLTGFEQIDNTTQRPFTTNPGRFITNAAAPSSFELALTDENFKFLQVWRSDVAVDVKLPWGIVGTAEFLYSRNVNGYLYYNVNQVEATENFKGVDNRPRYPGVGLSGPNLNNAIRINPNTVNAIYLTNTNQGYSYLTTFQLEKRFTRGFYGKAAYTFGQAKDLMSAGSIAAGSWNGARSVFGNNNLDLAFSDNDLRHRVIGAFSYRLEYAKTMATMVSVFIEGVNQGRFSYTYAQDMNGDGVNGNDLIFVPERASDLVFRPITNSAGDVLFTAQQQAAAFDAYIDSDPYLTTRRGQYAERNGGLLPWLTTADLAIAQEFFINAGGKRNTLQFRADIFNFTNFLSKNWGVGQRIFQPQILTASGVNAEGIPQFQMRTVGNQLVSEVFQYTGNLADVWRMQLGVRYIFN